MRKKWITTILTAIATVCCVFFAACGGSNSSSSASNSGDETQIYVLNELSIDLGVDETFTLQVLGNDSGKAVEWNSSDVNIVTVEDGVVVGVAPGRVNVTATVDEQELVCEVTVAFAYDNAIYVALENQTEEIVAIGEETINGYTLTLNKSETYTLAPSLIDGEKVENVTFTVTSESEALTVNGKTITAVAAADNAEVKVSCEYEGKTYVARVFVTVVDLTAAE